MGRVHGATVCVLVVQRAAGEAAHGAAVRGADGGEEPGVHGAGVAPPCVAAMSAMSIWCSNSWGSCAQCGWRAGA